jgi:hypothetical protein
LEDKAEEESLGKFDGGDVSFYQSLLSPSNEQAIQETCQLQTEQ